MEAAPLSTDEFIRIGDAARLLAFHLGQRFASNGHAHLGTARDKLLNAAKARDAAGVRRAIEHDLSHAADCLRAQCL